MGSGRVLLQAIDMLPGLAPIVAAEQPGRLHTGIEAAIARRHAPHRLDRLFARLVGEALARVRPALAEIGRLPDGRAEPFVAAASIDRAGFGVADNMVHRPVLAEGTAEFPRFAPGVAFEDERAFPGADEDEHSLFHDQLLPAIRSRPAEFTSASPAERRSSPATTTISIQHASNSRQIDCETSNQFLARCRNPDQMRQPGLRHGRCGFVRYDMDRSRKRSGTSKAILPVHSPLAMWPRPAACRASI